MYTVSIAYLNGQFMPAEQCKISALDRGFIFGDAIYELIPVYNGRGFAVHEHLERLSHNLAQVNIANPYPPEQWQQLIEQLIQKSAGGDQSIYVQVTRGVAERAHVVTKAIEPTVFAMAMPLNPVAESVIRQGIAAITATDIRWQRCDIKTTSLLANVLLRHRANQQAAEEAILIRNGLVTEGAAANVFVLVDNQLLTPPISHLILPGVTRGIIMKLAKEHGQIVAEQAIAKARLYAAQEIWLSSSSREILPVTRLDGKSVGTGKPGPVWKKFKHALNKFIHDLPASA